MTGMLIQKASKTMKVSLATLFFLFLPTVAIAQNNSAFIEESRRRIELWRDCLYRSFVTHAGSKVELSLSAEYAFQSCVTEENAARSLIVSGNVAASLVDQIFVELRLKYKTEMISGWRGLEDYIKQKQR